MDKFSQHMKTLKLSLSQSGSFQLLQRFWQMVGVLLACTKLLQHPVLVHFYWNQPKVAKLGRAIPLLESDQRAVCLYEMEVVKS
jgi:hypothetical protein